MRNSYRMRTMALALMILGVTAACGIAQLRIVDYNTAGVNNSAAMQTVMAAISSESVNGVVKPIDVIVLEELSSGDIGTMTSILNGLNVGTYVASGVGGTTGAGGVGLIYRTQSVDLIEQLQIADPNVNGVERGVQRFILRPDGYDAAANFYIYGSHYKASDGLSERTQRGQEAAVIRANSDALGRGAHIIYTGDFNIYNSSEPMWTALTAAGNGQAFDPVNQVGNWHDNSSFIAVHTQNPAGSGFFGGGMDDRFDWQMVTSELQDNEGMSIIASSYHAFGNNGTHAMNGHINTGTGASPTVLNALGSASDHLPVVAQYQVPAKMSVAVSTVPAQLLVNALSAATVTVSNSAMDMQVVTNAIGADELDYTITASGSASGSVAASAGSNNHDFTLNTATAGPKTATFTTNATSPQVPSPNNVISRNYTVLDHATASFTSPSQSTELLHDFGSITIGSASPSFDYQLTNLMSMPGFTAGLDFDSVVGSGNTSVLTTNLAASAGMLSLAAGMSHSFSAILNTSTVGSFSATYMLSLSDENIAGALNSALTLTLTGQIVSALLAGDYNDDGTVDAVDYVVWRKNVTTGLPLQNETASLGTVDQADYDAWRANFGNIETLGGGAGASTSGVVVPEPSPLMLLLPLLLAAGCPTRRYRPRRHGQIAK